MTELHNIFSCGRLCLLGEHSDWAGRFRTTHNNIPKGQAIIVGTREGLYATAERCSEKSIMIKSRKDEGTEFGSVTFALKLDVLLNEAKKGGFWSYAAGTAYQVLQRFDLEGGIIIDNYKTTLPLAKGLSSSAAFCVLVVRAFSAAFGLGLSVRDEMDLAYLGEITTPSLCGRLDQACAFGAVPLLLAFDGDALDVEELELGAPLHLVLVDLAAQKDTVAILRALQAAYPEPKTAAEAQLHELLGAANHGFVARACAALREGDPAELGEVMVEAQAAFDAAAAPLCPEQLRAPALHKILAWPSLAPLVFGSKGVGSQGDGSAQLLCRGEDDQKEACRVLSEELGLASIPLTVERRGQGHGARQAPADTRSPCTAPRLDP